MSDTELSDAEAVEGMWECQTVTMTDCGVGAWVPEECSVNWDSDTSAFLGMSVGDDYSPLEANACESQSGDIIEMLKKLRDESRSKFSDCQKEEMNSKNAYDMVQQDLIDSIENSNVDIEEKIACKESKIEKRAMDERIKSS